MPLEPYRERRDFSRTPEPGGRQAPPGGFSYVIQKHDARRLHFDLRLELDGVLKSWAVPKGPSVDPGQRRLAVQVEDHPIEYGGFEGVIPPGEYGAGTVMIWDRGVWVPEGDPREGYRKGHLRFRLEGGRLRGHWTLARMGRHGGGGGENWLLIKHSDEYAGGGEPVHSAATSIASGRSLEAIAAERDRLWSDALPSGAPAVPLPERIEPQLATLVERPPSGPDWLHEIKYDGYRILARIRDGQVRLITRRGNDWTARLAPLVPALRALPLESAWLDGEAAILLPDGTTSFQALQNLMEEAGGGEPVYLLFDLLHLNGRDLTALPLRERKAALAALLGGGGAPSPLRYSDHVEGEGDLFFEHACRAGLEGIVSKRRDRPFRPGRSREWLKVKCLKRQEFVIGGFTDPRGSRGGFGALLLGVYDGARLIYTGRVGTGFTEASLGEMGERLRAVETDRSPFAVEVPGAGPRRIHWVRPELVAEIAFSDWTADGVLRHPSFQGLREDKPPGEVIRERPALPEPKPLPQSHPAAGDTVAGVRLSNPDKVLYPRQGLTKRDIARFYEQVAEWVVPQVADRPLTLLRCPDGREGGCFFQKHASERLPPGIRRVPIQEKGMEAFYLAVGALTGVVGLVQMGVLEIHVWGARADRPDAPDQMVFDLDPDPTLPWEETVGCALRLREWLEALGLIPFVRTTGGKGLHVVVPLRRRHRWDEVRGFSHAVAAQLARENPGRYTTRMAKSGREGRIFIDYLRNARGATAVAGYTLRARPGAPVATPLEWGEIGRYRADAFTLHNLADHLARRPRDPWAGFNAARRVITRAMRERVGM